MMQLSDEGVYFLAAHEGIVPAPYLDSVGVWTYGIGHAEASGLAPNPRHMPRGLPDDLDEELRQVFEVFRADMEVFSRAVNQAIRVPVAQHEFDAAVSFHFNTGGIHKATWVKTLNAGDRDLAARQMMNWRRPPEIIPRREAEMWLFRDGEYGSKRVAVFAVSASHQPLYGRVLRSMSKADVIRAMGRAPKPATAPRAPIVSPRPAQRPDGLAGVITSLFSFMRGKP